MFQSMYVQIDYNNIMETVKTEKGAQAPGVLSLYPTPHNVHLAWVRVGVCV